MPDGIVIPKILFDGLRNDLKTNFFDFFFNSTCDLLFVEVKKEILIFTYLELASKEK